MNYLDGREGAQYICKVLYESLQIPVFLLDANQRIELALPSSSESAPWVHNLNELLSEIADSTKSENNSNHDSSKASIPIIRTTSFLENYILLHLPSGSSNGEVL